MQFTPFRLNLYLLKTIPIAWLAGIRVREISSRQTVLTVRHRWINQNPFRSVYFGVLVMAGELATGIPLFREVLRSGESISMLVIEHRSLFFKKATGRIRFEFRDYDKIRQAIVHAVDTGNAVQLPLTVQGINEQGEIIGEFLYRWSIKKRRSG